MIEFALTLICTMCIWVLIGTFCARAVYFHLIWDYQRDRRRVQWIKAANILGPILYAFVVLVFWPWFMYCIAQDRRENKEIP